VIPFIPPPVFHIPLPFGSGKGLTLYGFGICVATAILLGVWLSKRRARQLGLSEMTMADLAYAVLIGGFVGAHLVDVVFYRPAALLDDPWLILKIWNGISSFGGFVGATIGGICFLRWKRTGREERWGYLEATIFSLPFGWIFGRLGCSLAHDHPGILSDAWFAVQAPPLLYQRTLGLPAGSYLDLGLLELAFTILLAGGILLLDRRRRPVGFYLAWIPLLYAPVRFGLDFLRTRDVRYLGLTPGQYVAIGLLLLGGYVWVQRPRNLYGFGPELEAGGASGGGRVEGEDAAG